MRSFDASKQHEATADAQAKERRDAGTSHRRWYTGEQVWSTVRKVVLWIGMSLDGFTSSGNEQVNRLVGSRIAELARWRDTS
jgi:hypothetical protein